MLNLVDLGIIKDALEQSIAEREERLKTLKAKGKTSDVTERVMLGNIEVYEKVSKMYEEMRGECNGL